MNSDFSIYKFFKGESRNPFESDKSNIRYQFWGYEQLFEMKFNEGNFSEHLWIPPNTEDFKEWETILDKNPMEKEKLFKLWLFNLLMVHLPEKYLIDLKDEFLELYFH